MTKQQWNEFSNFKNEFKSKIEEWKKLSPDLKHLQEEAAKSDDVPFYNVENQFVYNHSLDEITQNSEIKLVVVGDNPGKNEQETKKQRYLVGQAGKVAENFFKKHPELGIDFRKNVIILNKTPIHTAKTKELNFLLKNLDASFSSIFVETQKWCAKASCQLANLFNCPLWLVGYGELKNKSIFAEYAKALTTFSPQPQLYVFQHFSMNRFAIDLAQYQKLHAPFTLQECLVHLGESHRKEILGK